MLPGQNVTGSVLRSVSRNARPCRVLSLFFLLFLFTVSELLFRLCPRRHFVPLVSFFHLLFCFYRHVTLLFPPIYLGRACSNARLGRIFDY